MCINSIDYVNKQSNGGRYYYGHDKRVMFDTPSAIAKSIDKMGGGGDETYFFCFA